MIDKLKTVSFFVILIIMINNVQGQIGICTTDLKVSFLNLKSLSDSDTISQKHNFFTSQDYEKIYSIESFNEIIQVLNLLELPNGIDSVKRIRIIGCSFITGAYSYWYIILQDSKRNNYFYQYQNNLGIDKVLPTGKLHNEDFVWKTADLLYGNRDGKSEDYMIMAEIKDNSFSTFKSTQTFHFRDNTFLRMTMRLIDKFCD